MVILQVGTGDGLWYCENKWTMKVFVPPGNINKKNKYEVHCTYRVFGDSRITGTYPVAFTTKVLVNIELVKKTLIKSLEIICNTSIVYYM